MKIETGLTHEVAFRIAEERIRTVLKERLGKRVRMTGCPHWLHRTIEKEHQGNGLFLVRVRGAFRIWRRHRETDFTCDFAVRVQKYKGTVSFVDVDGGVRPSIGH